MTNNYSQSNLSFLNPIYNISQLLQLTKYFSHPSIYPSLHSKQISLNYIITSNNQFYPKHHQQINQLLHSQPISNNNFSAPPLSLQLQSQPQQPQFQTIPAVSQPIPPLTPVATPQTPEAPQPLQPSAPNTDPIPS